MNLNSTLRGSLNAHRQFLCMGSLCADGEGRRLTDNGRLKSGSVHCRISVTARIDKEFDGSALKYTLTQLLRHSLPELAFRRGK